MLVHNKATYISKKKKGHLIIKADLILDLRLLPAMEQSLYIRTYSKLII